MFVFSVPFTFRWALCLARPTGLSATQAYSPACSPLTAGIVRAETLSPNAVIRTPSPTSKWRPSNHHLSEIGVSPFTTAQWTIIRSPELASSNANGCRCGETAERYKTEQMLEITQAIRECASDNEFYWHSAHQGGLFAVRFGANLGAQKWRTRFHLWLPRYRMRARDRYLSGNVRTKCLRGTSDCGLGQRDGTCSGRGSQG